MSNASASTEAGKNNLYENYSGEIVNPVFYALGINDKFNEMSANPNSSTSGIIEVTPREAGSILSTDLLVGSITIPVGNRTPAIDKKIEDNAEVSGGVRRGGVVALKSKLKEREKSGREQGQ